MANKYLTNEQYTINRQQLIDDQLTNAWLKENNIKVDSLQNYELIVLHASLKATKTLRYQIQYLEKDQIDLLNDFLNKLHSSTKKHLNSGNTFKVLNICVKAQRKEQKYLKQARQKIHSIQKSVKN